MLDEDEAVMLAVLLEELAARGRLDPLGPVAAQAAALLRERVAAGGQRRGAWLGPADPAARREAGDDRDDRADSRDDRASERDHRAGERDEAARDRDRLADDADELARVAEQRIRELLWNAAEAASLQPPASADEGGQSGEQPAPAQSPAGKTSR